MESSYSMLANYNAHRFDGVLGFVFVDDLIVFLESD
jgi:hypothetical protein